MTIVVDASALFAVLLDERGADRVVVQLRGSMMSTVNASECFVRTADSGVAASTVRMLLENFEINLIPFELSQAVQAADLRPITRHVGASFGDRACLALGMTHDVPVLTADRRLAGLDIGIDIRMIR